MPAEVLYRKWRPQRVSEVAGQEAITRTLRNAVSAGKVSHAYLFSGPRGTGKTSIARILARTVNCASPAGGEPCDACPSCVAFAQGRAMDLIEMDAASNRGIDEVKGIREKANYAPAIGPNKVYIIDEVHMLTEPAFNALLKTLEEPPAHVVFVLATTEARRLPATILSRCQRFDFRPIAATEIVAALERIGASAGAPGDRAWSVEPEALRLIAHAADGSLRDALSLLDTALAYGEDRVTAAVVRELLGSGGAEAAWSLADTLVRRVAGEALERIGRAAADGLDLGVLCEETLEVLRQALVVRTLPAPPPELATDEVARLRSLAEMPGAGGEELLLLVKGLLETAAEMRRSPHPRVDLEVGVVRLCHRPRPEAIETVLARLEEAEARLRGYGAVPPAPGPVQPDLLGGPGEAIPLPARASAPAPPPAPGRRPAPEPSRPAPAPDPGPPAGMTASPGGSEAEAWELIVAEVSRVRPTLGHLLAEATVVGEDAGRLTVSVANGNVFAQDQLRRPANREILVEVARRIRPGLRDVVLTTGTGGPASPGAVGGGAVADHPAVRAALDLFDGEIAAVRPLGPRAAREGAPDTGPPSGTGGMS
jgi:DNA polymerase-3 subunit gamma/tau